MTTPAAEAVGPSAFNRYSGYINSRAASKLRIAEIGAIVRSRRVQLGLSQERLGHFSGLSRVIINQLECGTIKDFGIAKLIALTGMLKLRAM